MEESEQFASELHHRMVRKFKRRKVIVNRLDENLGYGPG